MKQKTTRDEYLAALFVGCAITLIIIIFVKIWISDLPNLNKLGLSCIVIMGLILLKVFFAEHKKAEQKIKDSDKSKKSFQERLEEKAKEKGVKL